MKLLPVPVLLAVLAGFVMHVAVAEEAGPAVVGHDPKLHSEKEIKKSFAGLGAIVATLKDESVISIHEGLPRFPPKAKLPDSERKPEKTLRRYGFSFYQQDLKLKDEDAKTLRSLIRAPGSFEEFRGFKFCGGFHPDFAVTWKDGEVEVELHLCFGCSEARVYRGGTEVYCEIGGESYERFKEILDAYRTQRPEEK
ncbi:hypothetical protein OKA04_09530 [Luteolibacter flavescens]|uniref:Uncharacterized protein n=1 Tax=Luteolibacter flavescens TaxID=1859460 RepID=A0ABT3FN12_9BACT|nr:hypothetical protein [Luteolibacter flavescens]MCW1884966.1 hypothetical protein [Luteolibacter flavescens]